MAWLVHAILFRFEHLSFGDWYPVSIASFFSRIVRSSARHSVRPAILQRRNRRQQHSRWQRAHEARMAEVLEDRTLLATFNVSITADELDAAHGGVDTDTGLSLREAVIDANNERRQRRKWQHRQHHQQHDQRKSATLARAWVSPRSGEQFRVF